MNDITSWQEAQEQHSSRAFHNEVEPAQLESVAALADNAARCWDACVLDIEMNRLN